MRSELKREAAVTPPSTSVRPALLVGSGHYLHRSPPRSMPLRDRRRHQRIKIKLLGRFMRENQQEYPCQLFSISAGGAAMMAPVAGEVGERIVAYIDEIGRIEGEVVRTFEGGFAMRINATQHKREKLVTRLTWLVNRDRLKLEDERRHMRRVVSETIAQVHLEDGRILSAQILDVSLSGASLALSYRPPVGTRLLLGKTCARVVRHHDRGVGVEFCEIQNPKALKRFGF